MTRIFGEIALLFALIFSFFQTSIPLWGYWRNKPHILFYARPFAWGQFFCILDAYLFLTAAFASNNSSIAYVAANSHPSLPIFYRLTAVWGAHEGSMLLWVFILNIWAVIFSINQKNNIFSSLVLSLLGSISFFFLCFILLTSNPFQYTPFSQVGQDLNPLLQDIGFIMHPPMLYAGYAGFSIVFAISLAGLLHEKLDTAWATLTRHFALAAWCFLTLGISLGSWWAYRVLGWGGFWFWDPVENMSLLPWLAGTALIHILVLTEKRGIAKRWAIILAITCFTLSLLATFLVRSGMLISAHTFANDPARGVFLLLLLALITSIALVIYAIKSPIISSKIKIDFTCSSREMSLIFNSALLVSALLTILLGTLYPLILDALHLGAISVGAPYFNIVMAPFMFIAMICLGMAPLCHWKNKPIKLLWGQVKYKLFISIITALLALLFFTNQINTLVLISLILSLWVVLTTFTALRYLPGMSIAHLGFIVMIIGIIFSSVYNEEREVRMKPGGIAFIGSYQFVFLGTQNVTGSNYNATRANFLIKKNNDYIANIYPEKRIYPVRELITTVVGIQPGIFRDLYISLGELLDKNYWSVRIYYKPFVRFIWLGSIIMIMGGLLAITQRKRTLKFH